jgi:hypothetical protein
MPVSETSNRMRSCFSRSATQMPISPFEVNFTAFPHKLRRIWRMRPGSPRILGGIAPSILVLKCSPRPRA